MAPRSLHLERPLVAFDLETTGLNVQEDRIVEISCVKMHPNGDREIRTRRLNPERPISEEASSVHGIADADVADAPAFRQVARGLLEFLEGCDLTGFNLESFDLPMLAREFERVGTRFPSEGTRIVDSRKIYMFKEPRNLAAAYALYCGGTIEAAHSAEADAVAAADILAAQVQHYPDLPADVAGLQDFCSPDRVDWIDETGKLMWRDGQVALGFGKYRHTPLQALVETDRGYLEWIVSADFPPLVKELIGEALAGEHRTRPEAAAEPTVDPTRRTPAHSEDPPRLALGG